MEVSGSLLDQSGNFIVVGGVMVMVIIFYVRHPKSLIALLEGYWDDGGDALMPHFVFDCFYPYFIYLPKQTR